MKLQITQKQLCQILTGALHCQVESVEIVNATEETQKDIAVKPAVSENSSKPHNPDGLTPVQSRRRWVRRFNALMMLLQLPPRFKHEKN